MEALSKSKHMQSRIIALVVSVAMCASLYLLFTPRWETNDDIGMSMVAHGYGTTAYASANLIFSNVIWGYVIQLLPSVNGVLGYSLAAILVMIISCSVLLYILHHAQSAWLFGVVVTFVIFLRPLLFPQFTINAGMMTLAGIVCWMRFRHHQSIQLVVVGCVCVFLGYLIRNQEAYLLLLVASPLIPWILIWRHYHARLALFVTVAAVVGAFLLDAQAYSASEWRQFNNLNQIRAQFTDYNADKYIKARPEIMAKYGYSENDINLVRNWFFVDASLVNPQTLSQMLAELGPISAKFGEMKSGWASIQALAHPQLRLLFVLAICFLVLNPSSRVFLSWILCVIAVFLMGIYGRPGVLRVYVPIESLLIVAPLLVQNAHSYTTWHRIRKIMTFLLVCIIVVPYTLQVTSESVRSTAQMAQLQADFRDFPRDEVVVWGASFPFEAMYPVLQQSPIAMQYQLHSLGAFTTAPFSRAFVAQHAGNGMVATLLSRGGIRVLAAPFQFELLRIYCAEHYSGELIDLSQQQFGKLQMRHVRCIK